VPIRQIVTDTLRQRIHLPRGSRVLAAVSGGADSVALTWVLHELSQSGAVTFVGIAHVHHQLRGADADADEAFCHALAARVGVACVSGRVDVTGAMTTSGGSVESVARRLRYAWLEAAAREIGATHVATGHTQDDQAETVLLRLLRGAGGRGISGVRAARGVVIRPLIDCRRQALREYLAARGESFRDDRSNADLAIPRNRLRHELLPVIERLAPGGIEALARAASLAADDEKYLGEAAIEAARSVVLRTDGSLERDPLSRLAPAIARRVIRDAIERAAPERAGGITAAHLDAVWHLVKSGEGGHLDLAGVAAEVEADAVRFTGVSASAPAEHRVPAFDYALAYPGRTTVSEANFVITAERCDQTGGHGVETNGGRGTLEVAVDTALIVWPLTIRNRRPGDGIKPLGGRGRKKVQDLLVDMKMPRADRDRVAVVVDASGQLVWVVGVTPADVCRVRTAASGCGAEMVVLRAERQ
jgi:tRNA(Ile)-lysidine synthase